MQVLTRGLLCDMNIIWRFIKNVNVRKINTLYISLKINETFNCCYLKFPTFTSEFTESSVRNFV